MEAYGIKGDEFLDESLTYSLAMMEDLQHQLNNNTISRSDLTFLNFKKKTLAEYQKERRWTCGKVCLNMCNKTFNSKFELLQHELGCFNIQKVGSAIQYKYVECSICGKKFYDKGQKLKPKYALAHHQNTCRKTKKKRQKIFIKKALEDATEDQVNTIYRYLNNNEQIILDLPKIPSPEPEPVPSPIQMEIIDLDDERPASATSVSTTSSLDDWEYQYEHYWVDNKNRVYDKHDNLIGIRFRNDIDNWEIEYEENNKL